MAMTLVHRFAIYDPAVRTGAEAALVATLSLC
jgi:hypothetical protein